MNKRFLFVAIITTIINLLLHRQLHRPPAQLIPWAIAATSLLMGFFITMVMKWSGALTFISGLKKSFFMGFLFWSSVNVGLYTSSTMFSEAGVFVDLLCSGTAMTLSGACAAWS